MRGKTENSEIEQTQSREVPRRSILLFLSGVNQYYKQEVHSDGINYGKRLQ